MTFIKFVIEVAAIVSVVLACSTIVILAGFIFVKITRFLAKIFNIKLDE